MHPPPPNSLDLPSSLPPSLMILHLPPPQKEFPNIMIFYPPG